MTTTRRIVLKSLGAAALGAAFAPRAALASGAPLKVVATTGMIADTASAIGGDLVEVKALMAIGVSCRDSSFFWAVTTTSSNWAIAPRGAVKPAARRTALATADFMRLLCDIGIAPYSFLLMGHSCGVYSRRMQVG